MEGRRTRRFDELKLERQKVVFLPLHWTVVHPIDESSPLYGLDEANLQRKEVEILIVIKGIDEIFSETIYARSSYLHDEVLWRRRFRSVFHDAGGGRLAVDLRELSETDPVDVETAA